MQAQALAGPAIRVLDQNRLLRESTLGQALLADLRAAEAALEAENEALAQQLAAEERALTDLRATLPPDEFRARAEAFDQRVEAIRAERARLGQELARRYEIEAQRFFQTALPVLTQLMAEEGVVALLSPDVVLLGAEWLDLTPRAIERLNRATGN
jgi:Skp family chaperone for outer membrane proteins